VAAARQDWKNALQPQLDPKKLVFIDETGTTTNMARQPGRCRRGARLIGRVPHRHWKTTTFVAGLRVDAVTAPFVIDQAMNGTIFRCYIERCLVPTLAPGDIVIMDNLPAHKVAGIRHAIAAAGAVLLFLPPPACAGAGSTRPISIRSSRSSPSSKRCCAKRPRAPSPRCRPRSASSSTTFPPTNAHAILLMPATAQSNWKML
jgi:transposase